MTLRLAVLQHEPETGLGRFSDLLDDHEIEYELVPTGRGALPDPLAFDGGGALILGGSLADSDATLLPTRQWIQNVVHSGLPYLGICLPTGATCPLIAGFLATAGAIGTMSSPTWQAHQRRTTSSPHTYLSAGST